MEKTRKTLCRGMAACLVFAVLGAFVFCTPDFLSAYELAGETPAQRLLAPVDPPLACLATGDLKPHLLPYMNTPGGFPAAETGLAALAKQIAGTVANPKNAIRLNLRI